MIPSAHTADGRRAGQADSAHRDPHTAVGRTAALHRARPERVVDAGRPRGDGAVGLSAPQEAIVASVRRWNALYGEPPCTADWNPSVARWRAQEWRIERYVAGDPRTGEAWPSLSAVKRRFGGSFDAALRAAGFAPHRPGPRRRPAGTARPDVAAREAPLPRDAHDAVVAARAASESARAEAARASAAAAAERARAQRAEAALAEARRRSRVHADRARRAAEARDRVRARQADALAAARAESEERLAGARARCEERVAAVRAVADREVAEARARVRSAEARAQAAEERARAAEAGARRGATGRGPAPVGASTRDEGPAGPGVLGAELRRLARIRAAGGDRGALRAALLDVATAAARWAERL